MTVRPDDTLHVVAGVLSDDVGRVLVAQRPLGKHKGGLWEFPGGKVEAGEAAEVALARELSEELGIEVAGARPFIRLLHRYPEKTILLDVWRVLSFAGEPVGMEGQPLRWLAPDDFDASEFPEADVPVLNAIRLPNVYAISPEPADVGGERGFLDAMSVLLRDPSIDLLQIRAKQLAAAEVERLVSRCQQLTAGRSISLLVNRHHELVERMDLAGVQLTSSQLHELRERPLGPKRWVGASCHDRDDLDRAVALGADFAVLSPVKPPRSHAATSTLGWAAFTSMVADCPIPVYALGGLGPADLPDALNARAQGVAGISAFWP